jgi:glucan 1,4-alpha-glucosidase
MKQILFAALFLATSFFSCKKSSSSTTTILSPNKNLQLNVGVTTEGKPYYLLLKGGQSVIDTSLLGFTAQEADFSKGFKVVETETDTANETWKTVWGQETQVKDEHQKLTVHLAHANGQLLDIVFKVFDDGLGYRYEFPKQSLGKLTITQENTQFHFTADHTTWWVPGCWDNDEYPYTESKLSKIDASFFQKGYKYSNVTTITNKNSVNTPVTLKSGNGTYISVHEAALQDFPGMSLLVNPTSFTLSSHLAESEEKKGIKAEITLPFNTPWRTVMVTSNAAQLLESDLILNLNEPNKLDDVSFIKPTKYMGIWWEMHVGKSAWDLKSGKHGANTANVKKYIDFCSQNGIPALLVEGWNTGWEQWVGDNREGIFDFVTPYSDFDMANITAYAKAKNVEIIGHHETASAVETYEKHMDKAYAFYQKNGIRSVKTGYVGKIPKHRHYDQAMVNHYNKTMVETAQYGIMLDIHEPIKPTGLCRTYPNLMSAEGMRGQEFNAWSDGNKPSHNVILPFTRNLAGPMDFTPGIFDLKLEKYKNNVTKVSSFDTRDGGGKPYSRVYSTLAHQLALYVVFYSPVQMAADLPENYTGNKAFQFIKDVVVDWEWTKILDAEIASHIVTVRKAKGQDKYFVGAITGEQSRYAKLKFDFLPKGKKYTATIYKDAATTNYLTSPEQYEIETQTVDANSQKTLKMSAAGGFAISIQ